MKANGTGGVDWDDCRQSQRERSRAKVRRM